MSEPKAVLGRWKIHMLVFLFFVVATLLFTWPLPIELGSHFAGDNIDVWINMWANWWTRKVIEDDLSLYHTTYLFYPDGAPLFFHSFSHTNTALALLIECCTKPLVAYNITILLGFALLGFGIYLLADELTGSSAAGIVAGLAATFAPYHVWESAHPTLFSTQYIPLLLWALVTTFRRPSWWRGVLIGLFSGLMALTGWHQPLYAAVIVGPYVLWALFVRRPRPDKRVWLALFIGAVLAGLLVGPMLFPLIREQVSGGYAQADPDTTFNTGVLSFLTPSFLNPLWGEAVRPIYEMFSAPNRPTFVGYTVLVLALLGVVQTFRKQAWLVIATLFSLVLALGTNWTLMGDKLVEDVAWYDPLIGFVRAPTRFNLVVGQCMALLAAYGVAWILTNRVAGKRRTIVTMILAAVVLVEFVVWPFPTTEAVVPPFYSQLNQTSEEFAIVEAPRDRQSDKFYMYWQTVHGKPMVNGHISRPPLSANDFIEGNLITRSFAQRLPLRDQQGVARARDALAETGVRYIVVHRDLLSPELAEDWIAALATRPVYADGQMTVFNTYPERGEDFQVWHAFDDLLLSQAWFEFDPVAQLHTQWSAPAAQDVAVTIRSDGETVDFVERMSVAPGTFSLASLPVEADLPVGEYEVELASEGDSFVLPSRLVVDSHQVYAARWRPDAVWGDAIALRGVDWHRVANALFFDLQWDVVGPVAEDYHFFIHLWDENGELVAQRDGVPCDWSCPTSSWGEGDWISDQVMVDLGNIPSDTYQVTVGWYIFESMGGIPGVDGEGQPLPDGVLPIEPVVIVP